MFSEYTSIPDEEVASAALLPTVKKPKYSRYAAVFCVLACCLVVLGHIDSGYKSEEESVGVIYTAQTPIGGVPVWQSPNVKDGIDDLAELWQDENFRKTFKVPISADEADNEQLEGKATTSYNSQANQELSVQPNVEKCVQDPVKNAQNCGKTVAICRGVNTARVRNYLEAGSAGGEPADPNTGIPTVEDTQKQVAEGRHLVEFSADLGTCDGHSSGGNHWLLFGRVGVRYLRIGSTVEQGVVALRTAPVEWTAAIDRTLVKFDKLKNIKVEGKVIKKRTSSAREVSKN